MKATDITGYPFVNGDALNSTSVNQICEALEIASERVEYFAGDNVTIENFVISAKDTTYDPATETEDGLMSAQDKTKLDGIEDNANNYTLPKASENSLGGVIVGEGIEVDENGKISAVTEIYDDLTTTATTWSSSFIQGKFDKSFKVVFVEELPETGETNTLYFIPAQDSVDWKFGDPFPMGLAYEYNIDNIRDEYMWVGREWEQIGSSAIDIKKYQEKLTAGYGIAIDSANTISCTVQIPKLTVSAQYSALKFMCDSGRLTPGTVYRIVDYVATVNSSVTNAMSDGNNFDILVMADSVNTLNENVHFIQHNGDAYFSGCKLSAWEGKYSIDNDTTRFDWADDENGKGVIYYLKDEYGNEAPYDFKSIMFKRNNGGDDTYCYTFGNNVELSINGGVNGCKIGTYIEAGVQILNDIVIGSGSSNNVFGKSCHDITIGEDSANNTFFSNVAFVEIGDYMLNNQILSGTIGQDANNVLTIPFTANSTVTEIAGLNSSDVLKVWTPADLIN